MASTYNYLGLELMATGENAGTWGTKTNTNLNVIQQAASGYHSQTIAGGAQTTALLITDGDSSSTTDSLTNAARNQVIELTGTNTLLLANSSYIVERVPLNTIKTQN